MIQISGLKFDYGRGAFAIEVPELTVARGETVAMIGPSGVGKTTLISLIAGILPPQSGSVSVDGVDLAGRSDRERRDFRITRVGFVFQEFELVEYLPVRENILLPYFLNDTLKLTPAVRKTADELAAALGMGDKLRRYPKTLSQGEKQRVAICRALIAAPPLLIADEPTGNLDPKTADTILELLLGAVRDRQATLLVVTHNHALLAAFDRVIDIGTFNAGAAK